MFERRWLLTPLLGTSLLVAACSGNDDKPEPAGADSTATSEPGASAVATSPTAGASTGGTSPTAVPTALASSRTPTLADNIADEPCTILSDDEMKAAAGGAVVSAQGVPDRVQPFCRWLLDPAGQAEPVIQTVVVASIGNTALFDNPGVTKVTVDGLGDAAYVVQATGSGSAAQVTLWVRSGPKTLQVQVVSPDPRIGMEAAFRETYNTRALEIAEAIAKTALERF